MATLRAAHRHHRGGHQNRESQTREQQTEGELGRARRLRSCAPAPARSTRKPAPARSRRSAARIETSSQGTAKPKMCAIGAALREQAERRARLLEGRPEQRRRHEQHQDRRRPLAFLRRPFAEEDQPGEDHHRDAQQAPADGRRKSWSAVSCDHAAVAPSSPSSTSAPSRAPMPSAALRFCLPVLFRHRRCDAGCRPAMPRCLLPSTYCTSPSEHARARHAEAQPPADPFSDIAADERRDQRADVDPHVEDGETRNRAADRPGGRAGRQWC